jgi:hypothetical protein
MTHGTLETSVLGIPTSMPLFISPAAMAKLGHPLGEVNLTRAAGDCGVVQAVCPLFSLYTVLYLSLYTVLYLSFYTVPLPLHCASPSTLSPSPPPFPSPSTSPFQLTSYCISSLKKPRAEPLTEDRRYRPTPAAVWTRCSVSPDPVNP